MQNIKIFLIALIFLVAVNCNTFIKTDYTEIDSILNEATYYSIDKSYGNSEQERVQKRINEIRETFPQTKQALQNVEVLKSTENYTIFMNESNKQVYLAIRGTVPSRGSDLKNDSQMFFNNTPERVQEINEVMRGKMTELANQGYSVNVSGHSLGGSLALFACADNSWVNHCEVHNPYLDDSLINKLKPIFDQNEMNAKVVIQETLNDFVSQHFPTTSLNVTYSVFELVQNVKGIGEHSSLGLFSKSFLEGDQQFNFNYPLNTAQEFIDFAGLCKSKFEEFINIIQSCKENQYYNFSSLSCIACPVSKSCRNNFLGPYNCPPSQIATSSGSCQSCSAGTYISEVGKNECYSCPVGHKCVGGVKTPCQPGTYTNYIKDTQCYICSKGTYQLKSGSTECYECPVGHKCPSTTEEPIPCPAGTYTNYIKDTQCYICSKGTYQLKTGQTGCFECPVGHKCPSTTEEPIPCPPGTYTNYIKDTQCYICDKGTYQLKTGQTGCLTCPVGHKCPSTTEEPIPCPAGTFTNYIKDTQCYICSKGTYQLKTGQTGCDECPVGHKCPSTTEGPIPCPAGTYTNYIKDTQCYICSKGTYQLQSGQTGCYQCPVGHKCPSTTEGPILCPEGTYTNYIKDTQCYNCSQGFVSNSDRSGCYKVQASLLQTLLLNKNQIKQFE